RLKGAPSMGKSITDLSSVTTVCVAINTRVSTDQGLEQDFNSLDARREACEGYIKGQSHERWRLVPDRYDDGGFSGGSMVRPALQNLLIDGEARRIDVIVVYKVDRSPWRPQRALNHRRHELERRAPPDRAQ